MGHRPPVRRTSCESGAGRATTIWRPCSRPPSGKDQCPELRPLPIELDGPSFILEGDGRLGRRAYLLGDRSGLDRIWLIDYAEETGEDLGDVHDRERWLYVGCEGSRDGYRDMEDFIAGLEANREIERTFCPRRSEAMEHFVASETSSTAGPRIANASSVSARSASVDERALGSTAAGIAADPAKGQSRSD